jgi:S-adenosylmethionine:tRNA ribosyltransferase-isomerase
VSACKGRLEWGIRIAPTIVAETPLKTKTNHVRTSDFDFDLPDDRIAQRPVEPRDRSRLMVLRRASRTWEHRIFRDLPDLLAPGDLLVRNNTRVVPARLVGHREATGGHWEGLFLRALPNGCWEILARTRGQPRPGEWVVVGQGLWLRLLDRGEGGRWIVQPESDAAPIALLERHGHVPLPPYIRKGREEPGDRLRYQTLYAEVPGAVAAPTAGLHFTQELFDRLDERGVGWVDVTLHVGLGTFRSIETDQIEDHTLHAEWAELSPETADLLNQCRAQGGRVVAVGTTSTRVLETSVTPVRWFEPFTGETALYLRPGHEFRGIDALITNFHLPRSSLLVLVSALAGIEFVRAAYAEAIREGYRFYSYGDAMLILPD